jgi:hypothetical protein
MEMWSLIGVHTEERHLLALKSRVIDRAMTSALFDVHGAQALQSRHRTTDGGRGPSEITTSSARFRPNISASPHGPLPSTQVHDAVAFDMHVAGLGPVVGMAGSAHRNDNTVRKQKDRERKRKQAQTQGPMKRAELAQKKAALRAQAKSNK